MKKLLIVLAFVSQWATAQSVGLEFKGVTIPELSEAVIKGVLKSDYVMSPEVLTNSARLTLSIRSVQPGEVLPTLQNVLRTAGVDVVERAGVFYVQKVGPAAPAPVMEPSQLVQPVRALSSPVDAIFTSGAPEEVAYHRPRGKSVEFLHAVAKMAGAVVPEQKGVQDVVIFGGSKATVAKVSKLLNEIDTARASLSVKAALIEFTEGETASRSFSIALAALGGRLGISMAAQTLANAIQIKGTNLQAALSAIDGDRRFRYVAEPQLRVMDGETARFVVGSEVPTRGDVVTDKAGNAVQGIKYRTAGVVVTVAPKVYRDAVVLKVGQQISSFALTTTSGIDSPTMLKRESETTISAQDGELIVLAGMDETRESDSKGGLSFLPSWLRSSDSDKTRSQLLLMLEVKKLPAGVAL